MLIDPKDQKPSVHQKEEPAAKFIEHWLKIREAQGWPREAATTELNTAAAALLAADPSDKL